MILIKTVTTLKSGKEEIGYLLNCGRVVRFESKEKATQIALKLNLNFDTKLLDYGTIGREYEVLEIELDLNPHYIVNYNKEMFLI